MIKFWSMKYLFGYGEFLDSIVDMSYDILQKYDFNENMDANVEIKFLNEINDKLLYSKNNHIVDYFNDLSNILNKYQKLLNNKGKEEANIYLIEELYNKPFKSANKVEINIFILTDIIFRKYWKTFYRGKINKTKEDIFYQVYYEIFNFALELNRDKEEEEEFLDYLCELYTNNKKEDVDEIFYYIQKDITKDSDSLYYKEFFNPKGNEILLNFSFRTLFKK